MARLHEYQGKQLLAAGGIHVPRGRHATSAGEARAIADELLKGGAEAVVIKIQAWTTGRAAIGGVAFATTAADAEREAARMLAMTVGNFPVTAVLVEEKLKIAAELFVSVMIDDGTRAPAMLLSLAGGTGIEERGEKVHKLPADVRDGVNDAYLRAILHDSPVEDKYHHDLAKAVHATFRTARECEARSVEINPIVITADGRVMAADCRMTIDDYAVFRHPEFGIDIARELDHPPTELERIAYAVEQGDHRGTFFFAQLQRKGTSDELVIGFHGAGGGGSMMSMDAITQEGFTLANFCDTSGNPSAAKVYAAARIILSQPGLIGYFGSGSGVASQEQYHSAYGLAKAFNEVGLDMPAVIRLGGNSEDRAVEVLEGACKKLKAKVEGYKKDDTPTEVAQRFHSLVEEWRAAGAKPRGVFARRVPGFVGGTGAVSFALKRGTAWIDAMNCDAASRAMIVKHAGGVLKEEGGAIVSALLAEELAEKDSEFIMAEVEMIRAGKPVVFVDMPIKGLDG